MNTARESAARTLAPALASDARAVVFDMDGTLLDTEALYRDAFVAAGADTGVHVTSGFHDRLVGLASRDRLPLLLAEYGATFPAARFFALYRQRKAAILDAGIPLRPGAASLLRDLRARGVPCAVATSATRATARRLLGDTGLLRYLDVLIARDDVACGKPDPQTHRLAAASLGCPPAACLALEDSTPGLLAAHAAGMITVAAGDTPPPDHVAVFCRAIVQTLADLRPHLPQWQLPIQ